MHKKFYIVCLALVLCMVVPQAVILAESGGPVEEQAPQVSWQNRVCLDLLLNLAEDTRDNLLLSPLSMEFGLSFLLMGSEGEAQQELMELMGLTEDELEAHYQMLKNVTEYYPRHLDVLRLGNVLFQDERVHISDKFLQNLKKYMVAEHKTLDFTRADTAAEINQWVAENTDGRIEGTLREGEDLSGQTLIFINTMYMDFTWETPFQEKNTVITDFIAADGKTVEVEMMSEGQLYGKDMNIHYFEGEGFQAARKSFKEGMFIALLPDEDLSRFLEDQDGESLSEILEMIYRDAPTEYPQQIVLCLPKMEIDYGSSLRDSLISMGIEKIFIEGLTALWEDDQRYPVGDILQTTTLQLDERGARGAAVTEVIIAGHGVEPVVMVFDRPFLFAIYDRLDKLVFVGIKNC